MSMYYDLAYNLLKFPGTLHTYDALLEGDMVSHWFRSYLTDRVLLWGTGEHLRSDGLGASPISSYISPNSRMTENEATELEGKLKKHDSGGKTGNRSIFDDMKKKIDQVNMLLSLFLISSL